MTMMRVLKTILNDFLHLFFPNICLLCRNPLIDGEEQLCLRCLCDLPHTQYHLQQNNPVEQLFAGKVNIASATAFFHYEKDGHVQKLIHSLKYYDDKELGYILGRIVALELKEIQSPLCSADLLIPIPLHPQKIKTRGYNQSEWIARGVSSILHIPIDTSHLARIKKTDTQTHKSVYERWGNVQSVFSVTDPQTLTGRQILLIDDVITTGSTIEACALLLENIPQTQIHVLALATPAR